MRHPKQTNRDRSHRESGVDMTRVWRRGVLALGCVGVLGGGAQVSVSQPMSRPLCALPAPVVKASVVRPRCGRGVSQVPGSRKGPETLL